MMKTYQIMGYPRGHTYGNAMIVAARNDAEAIAKAIQILRGRGCNVEPSTLTVTEEKPRVLERFP